MNNKLGYKATKKVVRKILDSGFSPLLLGDRGIGKTSLAFDIAREVNKEVYYLNVSQVAPESLTFPVPNNEKTSVNLITPNLNSKLVILDELTNRNPDIHSLLQSLVLDKRLGDVKYNDLNFIATGNRPENSILAVDLPRPLVERFVLIDMPVPTKEEWAQYTINNSGDLRFVQFILQAPDTYYYKTTEPEGLNQVPSPRNNTRTALLIKDISDLDEMFILVSGSSGIEVATAFIEFVKSGRFYSYKMFLEKEPPKNDSEVLVLIYDFTTPNNYSLEGAIKVFEFLDGSKEYRKFRSLLFTTIKEVFGPQELEKVLRADPKIVKFVKELKEAISS